MEFERDRDLARLRATPEYQALKARSTSQERAGVPASTATLQPEAES